MLLDLKDLQVGMEVMKTQVSEEEDPAVLQDFLRRNSQLLDALIADGRTAQVRSSRTHQVHAKRSGSGSEVGFCSAGGLRVHRQILWRGS